MKILLYSFLLILFTATGYSQWTEIQKYGGGMSKGAFSFVINNQAYVGGAAKSFWEFDQTTQSWTQKADFGGTQRSYAFSFTINGKGYAGGGDTASDYTHVTNDFWQYDPAANSWTKKANYGGGARDGCFSFVINGYAYVGIGFNGSAIVNDYWKYDPQADSWSNAGFFMGQPTLYPAYFVINNKAYICTNSSYLYQFDPATNQWTEKASYPGKTRQAAIGFEINGKGYVGLGVNSNYNTSFQDICEYDPVYDTWISHAEMTYPIQNSAWSVGFTIGNTIYAGTGVIPTDTVSIPTDRFFKFYIDSTKKAPVIFSDSTQLNFSSTLVGDSASMSLIIQNIGNDSLKISSVSITADSVADGVFIWANQPKKISSIKPGGYDTLTIHFLPKDALTYNAALNILSNAANSATLTIPVTGTGSFPPAVISTDVSDLDFGTVYINKYKDSSFTVTNTGKGNLNIFRLSMPTKDTIYFHVLNFTNGEIIKPDSSKKFIVRFTPLDTNYYSPSLRINSNALNGALYSIMLYGQGMQPSGVVDDNNNYYMKMYPNPVEENSVILVNQSDANIVNLDLVDINGVKVKSIINNSYLDAGDHTFSFDKSNLACGLYYLILDNGKDRIIKKVIVE